MNTVNIKPSQFKENGYYIRKSIDKRRGMTQYEIVKDIDSGSRTILMELNKPAYLLCKNELCLTVKEIQCSFLNSIPFAHTNKDKIPMYEYSI